MRAGGIFRRVVTSDRSVRVAAAALLGLVALAGGVWLWGESSNGGGTIAGVAAGAGGDTSPEHGQQHGVDADGEDGFCGAVARLAELQEGAEPDLGQLFGELGRAFGDAAVEAESAEAAAAATGLMEAAGALEGIVATFAGSDVELRVVLQGEPEFEQLNMWLGDPQGSALALEAGRRCK